MGYPSLRRQLEVSVTTVYGGHRTQIPWQICRELQIDDGDKIVWLRKGGDFIIQKAGTQGLGLLPKYSSEPTKDELKEILIKRGLSDSEIGKIIEGL